MILSQETSITILTLLLDQFKQLDLFPVIGAEIEFYLTPTRNNLQDLGFIIEAEKGENQFEIRIFHSKDIFGCAQKIENIKESLKDIADFHAKPFADQPGSAMHIHLHLENAKGENLYIKQENRETQLLLNSIGGLCAMMPKNMLIFAPYEEAYLRYKDKSLASPSKVCWGGNNRTAAIRIPIDQKFNRRLEHRVACADSCPFSVIAAILWGALKGIQEQIPPPEKLHGNAFLEQYDFPLLPQSYTEAKNLFQFNPSKSSLT